MSDDLLARIQRAAKAMSPFSAESTTTAEIEELLHEAAGALDYQPSTDRARVYLLDRITRTSTRTTVNYRWPSNVQANDVGLIHSPGGSIWWHMASGVEGGSTVTVSMSPFWRFPAGWARVRSAKEIEAGQEEHVAR